MHEDLHIFLLQSALSGWDYVPFTPICRTCTCTTDVARDHVIELPQHPHLLRVLRLVASPESYVRAAQSFWIMDVSPLTKKSRKFCGPARNSTVPSGAVTTLPAFKNTGAPCAGLKMFSPVDVPVALLRSPGTARTSLSVSCCV